MNGFNKTFILGFLGQDPETRFTQDGQPITTLSVATTSAYRDKQTNQMVEKTEWHKCVCFKRNAEVAGQYLKKGSPVFIEGSNQTRKWKDQQGQDRYTTEIKVNELQLLPSGKQNSASQQPQQAQQAPQQQGQYAPPQQQSQYARQPAPGYHA
jgi:single-strand DNA-binding protein